MKIRVPFGLNSYICKNYLNMYLFADSGSTKTNWIITSKDGDKITKFQTIGLNPYFVTKQNIISAISVLFPIDIDPLKIEKLFFYGSGCGNKDNYEHLREALQDYFFNAKVEIYSDMLATARAIFKNTTGIAAIIGTGTNSCVYNGESITQNAISLGYILGDEGSGAYIGKLMIKLYLEKRLTPELEEKIRIETGETHSSILTAVYKNAHPNRFLASFCVFIKNNIEHPQLQEIVKISFNRFFEKYVHIYPDFDKYQLGFCGSVALNFSDLLIEIAKEHKMQKPIFINTPLDELIKYHKIKGF